MKKMISARRGSRTLVLLICFLLSVAGVAQALPSGSEIVHGDAVIDTDQSGMTIEQLGDKLIVNWNDFSIGAHEAVVFVQPDTSSVALNRVLGDQLSVIAGDLSANGHIFLINPQGVLFGEGATVRTGGLIASGLDMSDTDFIAGRYVFEHDSGGIVTNQGDISVVSGGTVALIGSSVDNSGSIEASRGHVVLGAGGRVELMFGGELPLRFSVDEAIAHALVQNDGVIQAHGGRIILSAQAKDALLDTVVSNRGIIEARTLESRNGTIILAGGDSGVVEVSGTLDASGVGSQETGGTVHVTGDKVALVGSASIDVSGHAGGGTALVGGDVLGGNPDIANAGATFFGENATVRADALSHGDGGKVIVWSDDATRFYGEISARGGSVGGDGGFVETSGNYLDARGTVDTSAARGHVGEWLLDPHNITIKDTSNFEITPELGIGPIFMPIADSAILSVATLEQALANNSVTITTQTNTITSQDGDIIVDADIEWDSGNDLTLLAHHDIIVNKLIRSTASSGGDITLRADKEGTGQGTVLLNTYYDNVGGISYCAEGCLFTQGDITIYYNPTDSDYSVTGQRSNWRSGVHPYSMGIPGHHDAIVYMLVNNVQDLQNMQSNLYGTYALGRDIDATETSGWTDGDSGGFKPIGSSANPFRGLFDGNGHSITGLYINRPTTDYVGLFGAFGVPEFGRHDEYGMPHSEGKMPVIVRHVTMRQFDVTGRDYVGGLVGHNDGGNIDLTADGVAISGAVSGRRYIGGLIGYNIGHGDIGGNISHVSFEVANSGSSEAGGLVGRNMGGTLSDIHGDVTLTGGSITSSAEYVGGLVGRNDDALIERVFVEGVIDRERTNYIGGLIGDNRGGNVTESVSNVDITNDAVQLTEYVGGLIGYQDGGILNDVRSEGSLKVTINGSSAKASYIGGLVGYNTGTIDDALHSGEVSVISSRHDAEFESVGGLVGYNSTAGTIIDASNNGSFDLLGQGFRRVGGLIGFNDGGEIKDSWNEAGIKGLTPSGILSSGYWSMGGLAGENTGSIDNSYNTGDVVVDESTSIGGLVGTNSGSITEAYNTGHVSTGGGPTGGLVGFNMGAIVTAFNTGSVTSTAGLVGGIVGNNGSGGSVKYAYNVGMITGSSTVGGLIGLLGGDGDITEVYSVGVVVATDPGWAPGGLIGNVNNTYGGTISSAYWDAETSGLSESTAGTPMATRELQAALPPGFDDQVWRIQAGESYPELLAFPSDDGGTDPGGDTDPGNNDDGDPKVPGEGDTNPGDTPTDDAVRSAVVNALRKEPDLVILTLIESDANGSIVSPLPYDSDEEDDDDEQEAS